MKQEKLEQTQIIAEMQQSIEDLQMELNIEKQAKQNAETQLSSIAPKWSRLIALNDAIQERHVANEALLEQLPNSSPLHEALQGQINLDKIVLEHLVIPFGNHE